MIQAGNARLATFIVLLAVAGPIFGHHSFAMFEMGRVISIEGTVKEIQWTNPHCFLQVLVPGPDGTVEWSIEMHSPPVSRRMKWSKDTLRPGDKVQVNFHPARQGAPGGFLVAATGPDGRTHTYGSAP
jgi:hypothetical protein